MFMHLGNCYVVLPRHVAGADYFPRINLSTSAPVVSGTGTVIRPFWEGIDLALAVASEAMRPRCTAELEDLTPSRAAQAASIAQLLRLMPDGSEERVQILVKDRSYLTFDGQVSDTDGAEIAQGTSGAFAFSGTDPIGMAITSDDTQRATFMRAEEIRLNIGRYLSQSGSATRPERIGIPSETSQLSEGALPLTLVSASVPAIGPSQAPENMLSDGLFVFAPSQRMIFDFRFEPDEAHPLSRLRITSPSDGDYAVPKNVLVQVAIDAEGSSFRTYQRRQVGPDGVLDTGNIAQRFVRRLRVIVLDAWGDGLIAIDNVSAW
ncbi:hypothetical protein PSAL_020740 [Pseudooceanicola algae]|uniref:Uncharacterized protein n=2 Tax=Pseudooceanicola algae TaxID=1537215 RepID=A0A418SLC6_9RHOB|nr:hypothetical protein PSAL_020740 [Pseudooceanicola algae]